MNYKTLAAELLAASHQLHQCKPQTKFTQALQGQTYILWYIRNHGGAVRPRQISEQMNVSTARIAQALKAIEAKGWISRESDPNDRRRVLVKLTPAGEQVAAKQYTQLIEFIERALALLGEHDAKNYVRITEKLARQLQAQAETEC